MDRLQICRRVVLFVLTVLAFFVSILELTTSPTSVLENTYKFKNSSSNRIPDEPLNLGTRQNFCEAFYNRNVKMDIDFTVNVTTLSNRWTNIFQTDDLNSGFRIEISSDGLLAALVRSPDGEFEDFIGVQANGLVKAKTLTKINFSVSSKILSVKIDDGADADLYGDFRPTCNNVLIGGGYDSTRTTIGDVQAVVRIQALKLVTTFGFPVKAREIARIIFTLLMVGLACEYRKTLFKLSDTGIQN